MQGTRKPYDQLLATCALHIKPQPCYTLHSMAKSSCTLSALSQLSAPHTPRSWSLHVPPQVARMVGLDPTECERPEFPLVMSGAAPLPGSRPYAAAYGGHQFGMWAGQLGDGRAITLGEVCWGRCDVACGAGGGPCCWGGADAQGGEGGMAGSSR